MQNEKPADLSFACFQGEAWRVCQLSIYRHRGLLSVIYIPFARLTEAREQARATHHARRPTPDVLAVIKAA